MNQFLRLVLMVVVCIFSGAAKSDTYSDAFHALDAKNYEKAGKLLQPLAREGNPKAQMWLASLYYEGKGVAKNLHEAEKWFRLSAEHGNGTAQGMLGNMYYFGEGVSKDYEVAMKWYRLSADQGNPIAQYQIGTMTTGLEGVRWFRLAAEQGLASAQTQLGGWYGLWGPIACSEEGLSLKEGGCPKEYEDSVESLKWYRLAAAQGNATAQLNVGVAYEKGGVVTQDYREAIKWYRQAAEQGDSRAQLALGKTYAEGKGVPQDYVLAYMWINLAGVEADDNAIDKFLESRNSTVKFRDSLAAKMTAQQIGEAQRLSRECAGKKYKGC